MKNTELYDVTPVPLWVVVSSTGADLSRPLPFATADAFLQEIEWANRKYGTPCTCSLREVPNTVVPG